MSERMRESLSALLDGEATELELERVLRDIEGDSELRHAWVRYNAARGAVNGDQLANPGLDISRAVRAALAEPSGTGGLRAGLRQRLRPVASFAVAASVAATVVIGGQRLAQDGSADSYAGQSAVARPSAVGMLNSLGATAIPASYGTQAIPVLQPATRTAYRELARQRMNRYMQEHAEHAALNSPQGLISFARVPTIRK